MLDYRNNGIGMSPELRAIVCKDVPHTLSGFINVYRSGFYHKCGKQGAFDRHGGDIYPTRESAVAAIEPRDYYVDTVRIEWTESHDVAIGGRGVELG